MIKHLPTALLLLAPNLGAGQVIQELTMQLRDVDPVLRMQGGFAACMGGFGVPDTPEQTANAFTYMEWQDGGSSGGLSAYRFKDSVALVAKDGRFCEIATATVPQPRAAEIVRSTFVEMGVELWKETQAEAGCTVFTSPTGRRIEVTSGGQDPICADTPSSAIRVWNAGDE